MTRIVIFGNSGSGKSTLAKRYTKLSNLAYLDLDTVAWKPDTPGVREDFSKSESQIKTFTSKNSEWVIEGCYSSLISLAANQATEMIFLNLTMEECQDNCRRRPWERHKYNSKEEQDKNLEMLIDWVLQYDSRTDEFSRSAHKTIFESFNGKKLEITNNQEAKNVTF